MLLVFFQLATTLLISLRAVFAQSYHPDAFPQRELARGLSTSLINFPAPLDIVEKKERMAFKPRVVIAEVGLTQKPIQLETENDKLIIISFNGVACDILRSRGPRGFPAVGFFCHKS